MALSPAARRAFIAKKHARRAAGDRTFGVRKPANDNAGQQPRPMSPGLLAACIDAGGFDQNARFA